MAFLRALLISSFLLILAPHVFAVAACNDIDIDPTQVILAENQEGRSVSFTITNDNSRPFEIDDVRVQESNPYFDVSVVDVPNRINGNGTDRIRLRFNTSDVNGDVSGSFNLQVRGEFNNTSNACSFSDLTFTIDMTIEDGTNACTLIQADARNTALLENGSVTHNITVQNSSNRDFTIQGIAVFEDSSAFTATLNPSFNNSQFERVIPANSTRTYTIDIDSRSVNDDITDTVYVEIRGEYSDGVDCSSTEIFAEFDVTVEDTGTNATACSDITINAPLITVTGGETSVHAFTLINRSAQTFYVDEYTITDSNYQASFDPLFTPDKIKFQENEELTYNATGYTNAESFDSNATLALKGHFTNGNSCFITAKKIPFHFEGTRGATCNAFYAGLSPVNVLKGTNSMDVLFHNPLNASATVNLSLDQGNVSPGRIILSPKQVQLITLHFSGVQQNTILRANTIIPGCTIPPKQSELHFSGLDNAPVQFVNAPGILTIGDAKEFAIQLKNKSAFTQDVTIAMIAKPGNETFSRDTTIPGLDEPLIFLPTRILQGKSAVVIQVKSAGYTVTHTIQLENAQSISVIPSVSDQPNGNNTYDVSVIVQNNTPQTIEGNVIVDVPNGWQVNGNAYTQLGAYERKTISFTVKPAIALTEDRAIFVRFDSPRNASAPTPALLKVSNNPLANATALVTGTNGMWLGIIMILVLIGLWFVAKPKVMQTDTDSMDKIFSNPKKFSSASQEWPEEAWMNPSKKN